MYIDECFGEQDMQNSLDRESSSLQDLESQKQIAQERLEEMDQQRSKLEGMVNDVKQKCQEESQMVRETHLMNKWLHPIREMWRKYNLFNHLVMSMVNSKALHRVL